MYKVSLINLGLSILGLTERLGGETISNGEARSCLRMAGLSLEDIPIAGQLVFWKDNSKILITLQGEFYLLVDGEVVISNPDKVEDKNIANNKWLCSVHVIEVIYDKAMKRITEPHITTWTRLKATDGWSLFARFGDTYRKNPLWKLVLGSSKANFLILRYRSKDADSITEIEMNVSFYHTDQS